MSQENVEIVRLGIDAWNRRDIDTWLRLMADDVEWEPIGPAAVERSLYRGRGEAARGFCDTWEAWEVFRFEEAEVHDLGSAVLWLGRVQLKGSASHVELDQEFAVHFVLRNGEAQRIKAFPTWQEALKAAGLSE
jgi:ketosteroid isomerase-like protein